MRIKVITYRIGVIKDRVYIYAIKHPIWWTKRAIKTLISRHLNPCYPAMKRLKDCIEELEKKIERELEFRDDRIRIKTMNVARLETELRRYKRLERKGKLKIKT